MDADKYIGCLSVTSNCFIVRGLFYLKLSMLILFIDFLQFNLFSQTQSVVGEGLQKREEFVKIEESTYIKILMKYASADNFMHENLYREFNACYLHKEAYLKFQKAIKILKETKTNRKFIMFDCLRPRSIQFKLWEKVKGTANEPYVANPEKGSVHNFGFAIDLSLLDENGNELDMGTRFDDFTPLSEPTKEEYFLKIGKLTQTQLVNRKAFRSIMTRAGFIQRPNEWWHFDALESDIVKKKFKIVE